MHLPELDERILSFSDALCKELAGIATVTRSFLPETNYTSGEHQTALVIVSESVGSDIMVIVRDEDILGCIDSCQSVKDAVKSFATFYMDQMKRGFG